MNEQMNKLLAPVSASQPCGPDLSNDPRFDELENLLKGKPEVDIGSVQKPAEPPDWLALKGQCNEFLGQSKHLRVAMVLCCASLRTDGVPGFRDGLQLLRGLLEQYWATVYPLLDATDNNDPTQRLNIVSALTAPRGPFTGWLTILDYLYAAPVVRPKGESPITFEQLTSAKIDTPDALKLGARIRAANQDMVALHQALEQALEAMQGIDRFLTSTVGVKNAISFETLGKTLQEMLTAVKPFVPGQNTGTETTSAGGADGQSSAITIRGSIRSRTDVVQALETICEYYQQVEPSSPVPYLLRRAQRLAKMDFVQAMQELNLATIDALRPSMGSGIEPGAAPARGA
jgi:type VI secretion system protein ImpA